MRNYLTITNSTHYCHTTNLHLTLELHTSLIQSLLTNYVYSLLDYVSESCGTGMIVKIFEEFFTKQLSKYNNV